MNEALSCGCFSFFWIILWLSSLLFFFFIFSSAFDVCISCYNLSRTQWVHVREEWKKKKTTKKTCPRNVSISVKLIFWNLCYTSIKLIPSHIPSTEHFLHGWALVCTLLMKWVWSVVFLRLVYFFSFPFSHSCCCLETPTTTKKTDDR